MNALIDKSFPVKEQDKKESLAVASASEWAAQKMVRGVFYSMGLLLLLIFVAVPLIELSLLIEIGSDIGALPTIALCLLTAGVGLSLIRMQGLKVIADMQVATRQGKPLVDSLIHGFFLLIAGALLFFPGFMTDALGGILLIPPVRLMLGKMGLASMASKHSSRFHFTHTAGRGSHDQNQNRENGIIIEGDYDLKETDEPKPTLPKEPNKGDPENTSG